MTHSVPPATHGWTSRWIRQGCGQQHRNIHLKINSIGLCPQQLTDEGCKWSKPVKNSIYPNQHATLDPALFKGNNYRVVKVKYFNWTDKTGGVKEFSAR
ncbi:hypothetical protein QNM34_18125 [Rahnella bonaserana]|uniref:hypothetical protein n=1 Tax=Rahnella bonaserana TaxID=2816248 RepID=UPI0024C37741|nr:hypothetical protein [Rahnella bonaserana]WHZ39921.1 hypothetical protein QNM34_18125 [Rahnella bonaserana]